MESGPAAMFRRDAGPLAAAVAVAVVAAWGGERNDDASEMSDATTHADSSRTVWV